MIVFLGIAAALAWAFGAKARKYSVTVGDDVSIVTRTPDREPLPGETFGPSRYEGPDVDPLTGESTFSPYRPISEWADNERFD